LLLGFIGSVSVNVQCAMNQDVFGMVCYYNLISIICIVMDVIWFAYLPGLPPSFILMYLSEAQLLFLLLR